MLEPSQGFLASRPTRAMIERLRLKFGSLALTVETAANEATEPKNKPADREADHEEPKDHEEPGDFFSPREKPEAPPRKPTPCKTTTVPPKTEKPSKPSSYYVVWAVPDKAEHKELLGVHKITWSSMCKLLPGGSLAGSGVQDCKKFHTEAEAVEYYYRRHKGETECKVHKYKA